MANKADDAAGYNRTQAGVRLSEIHYQQIFESARDGILVLDAATRKIIAVNPFMAELSGYSTQEFLGKELREIGLLKDKEAGRKAFQELQEKGYLRYEDLPLETKAGELRAVEFVANAYAVGNSRLIQCHIRDITARKLAEETQHKGEEQHRLLVETERARLAEAQMVAKLGSWELDLRTDELTWSDENYRIFGVDRAKFGASYEAFLELLPPEDRATVNKAYTESVAKRTPYAIDHRLLMKDGSVKIIHERCQTFYDDAGRALRSVGTTQDITERKQAEEALIASEAALRQLAERQSAILDALPAHVCLLNAYGDILEVNARWKHFAVENNYGGHNFGIGTNYLEVCENTFGKYAEEARRVADGIRAVLSGSLNNFELEYPCHSAEEKRWFRLMVAPLHDDLSGGLVVMHVDVTERKAAEEALIKLTRNLESAVQEYQRVLDNSLDVICQIDEAGRFIQVSAAAQAVWGYEPEELNGRMYTDLVHPDDRAETLKTALDIMSGQPTHSFSNRYLHKDGSIVYMTWGANWSESDRAIFCVARDDSPIKQAEEALKNSEANYRNLIESSPAIVYLAQPDPPYAPLYVSPNIVEFGYQQEEWFTRPDLWVSILHDEDRARVLRLTREATHLSSDTELEYRIVGRDGRIHWVQDKGRFVFDRDGNRTGWQGVLIDITKTKQLEEQLRQSQKLESVGRLAGGIAHDFNNMLTAINGYSDLALRRLSEDDPLRRSIEEIRKAGVRSADLTHQLLAFSRQQILQPKIVYLNRIITEMSDMLRRVIGEDVRLATVLHPKAGPVKADPGQLSQIIMNLAVNARDAMPQGGTLTIETANIFLDPDYARRHVGVIPGAYVMLAVSDTGTGIADDIKEHIFEPFFTTKEVGKGTGLGLATTYGIVKQSGGNISVYSEEGIGTTIKVYLPRVVEQSEAIETKQDSDELPEGTETILLVEDEEIVRTLACQILELCGYTVLEASNGLEALSICEQDDCRIDLLMTDVVMPQMGGRELAERFAVIYPQMRILFTSGYTDDAIVRHGVIEAGTNFIQKPFTPDALAHKVREVLDAALKA